MSEQEQPGVVEKVKSLAKEATGAVLGDQEMRSEGRAEREGFSTEGRREYFRNVIEESNKRATGSA
ncbi:MAG: hypothetical protein JOZ19_02265 [Rubrobacter sp.]|nr:hypothetical protein [Rubrobacter sp.]